MPIGPQGQPLPYGPPQMPGMPGAGAPNPMAGNPFMSAQPPVEPIVKAGEEAITKLLTMASSNPQLLIGLSMAGAAREISQLTGLSRRKQGAGKGPAQPSAAAMLGGNMGDLDRMIALQSMLGGAPQPPMGGPMPGGPPGMPPGMPGQGAPAMPGMPPGGLPPHLAGLV